MTETNETIFNHFIKMDVRDHIDKKNGLSYLSWVWCWEMVQDYDSHATKSFTKFPEFDWNHGVQTGRMLDYCLTEQGCYVECTVTIKGVSKTETLPCMIQKPHSAPISAKGNQVDMMLINKTKQRCFVKACALFGLGLNLYAGEDEPLDNSITDAQKSSLNKLFNDVAKLNGSQATEIASKTVQSFGVDDLSQLDQKQAGGLLTSINRRVRELKQTNQSKEKVGNK